jgi:hypothetical protein
MYFCNNKITKLSMSVTIQTSPQRTKAFQKFSKGLPDPRICDISTIKTEITIENETITFLAQKAKGTTGMTWRITFN